MNRAPILFRCDGTPDFGWEFFYQCLTLGAALQRRRRPTYFLSSLSPMTLVGAVNRAGCEWIAAEHPFGSEEDCEAVVREVHRLGAASVVMSGPGITQEYLRELSGSGVAVTLIDSSARLVYESQLVINPMLAPAKKAYRFTGQGQRLLGGRYAIVRPIFRRQRPLRATEPPAPFRGMAVLGDDDFTGQAVSRTRQLLGVEQVEKVSVVARGHHPDYAELKDVVAGSQGRAEIISEPNEIGTRLGRSHFALTCGDGFSLELACVGVPQLVLAHHDRHVANGQRLDDDGAATYLGRSDQVSESDLQTAVTGLLSDPLDRSGMSRCARQTVDGRGPDRLVNAIEVMLRRGRAAAEPRVAA